jgi:hypothetical protein
MEKQKQRRSGESMKFALLLGPLCQTHFGHTLAQVALLQERPLQLTKLLVEEVIRLVNHTEDNVRHHFGWPRLDSPI